MIELLTPVIIESPYKASATHTVEEHEKYLRLCILDCLSRKESPYASHRILTGALDDGVDAQRCMGMLAGYAWYAAAESILFYCDFGWSSGMEVAWDEAMGLGYEHKCIHRYLK